MSHAENPGWASDLFDQRIIRKNSLLSHLLGDVLTEFEKYIHADGELSPLVRAGLLHVQFETIHPYLDLLRTGTELE